MIGKFCVIRTRNAGVHCGYVREVSGTAALVGGEGDDGCRRVYRWRGANTLNELANHGASEEWTRISEPVIQGPILLTEVIEILPCTSKATINLKKSRWG